MEITLLGTGGADGIPGLFASDRVSEHARQHGGKDIRTRSAALVDDVLKLDFGPDTWAQCRQFGVCAEDWQALLLTHDDDDHLAVNELQYCLYPFVDRDRLPFTIFGNGHCLKKITDQYPDWPLDLVLTTSFHTFGFCEYRITPIAANHAPPQDAHNFLIERDGRTLLYATDTGIWAERTWRFLEGIRVNLLVIECTEGAIPTPYNGHLDVDECAAVVDRLRRQGTLAPDAKVVTTHHAHTGELTHDELDDRLRRYGIQVGYDGWKSEV
jgi:phosphoribosyl 1,2-cyclic phosphate phosphodiesterase